MSKQTNVYHFFCHEFDLIYTTTHQQSCHRFWITLASYVYSMFLQKACLNI